MLDSSEEIRKHYDDSGNLIYKISHKGYHYHGPFIAYYRTFPYGMEYIAHYKSGMAHGISEHYDKYGFLCAFNYFLYGNKVTKEEYREHELIEELAKL